MTLANFAEVLSMGNHSAMVLGNRDNVTSHDRWTVWPHITGQVSLWRWRKRRMWTDATWKQCVEGDVEDRGGRAPAPERTEKD